MLNNLARPMRADSKRSRLPRLGLPPKTLCERLVKDYMIITANICQRASRLTSRPASLSKFDKLHQAVHGLGELLRPKLRSARRTGSP